MKYHFNKITVLSLAVGFIILLFTSRPVSSVSEPLPTRIPTLPAPQTTLSGSANALFDPATVKLRLTPIVDELEQAVYLTHAGDGSGRMFMIEKPGRIRILQQGSLLETPFLDIEARVNSNGNEQGLLGLAFAPDFAKSGLLWVNYIDKKGDTLLSRFNRSPDDPNQANPSSEFIILRVAQPASNHNGGMLAFGPDGNLYMALGDGGGANDTYKNGQNPDTLLGKILRLDVTSDLFNKYQIPPDNPWIGVQLQGKAVKEETWAMGLRNPWRFSFDRKTGDLWIGDVGQNQYEEIDRIPARLLPDNLTPRNQRSGRINFGWPLFEGLHCQDTKKCKQVGLTAPVLEFKHHGNCSVTGGYVYRGKDFPVLEGVYFYGDYCSGRIWAAVADGKGSWTATEMLDTNLSISSFGEDEAGELYVVDYSGSIQKLEVK